jgi:hypothetical protein
MSNWAVTSLVCLVCWVIVYRNETLIWYNFQWLITKWYSRESHHVVKMITITRVSDDITNWNNLNEADRYYNYLHKVNVDYHLVNYINLISISVLVRTISPIYIWLNTRYVISCDLEDLLHYVIYWIWIGLVTVACPRILAPHSNQFQYK